MRTIIVALIFLSFLSASCGRMDFYEQNTPLPGHLWKRTESIKGLFEITDTTSSYNIFIVLRHTDAYRYNNIWLSWAVAGPGDSLVSQKLDLPLGNDAGGWEGTGMNDIWEVRKRINPMPLRFTKPGKHQYVISQIMRDNPLEHVMSVGMRVEKAP